VQLFSLSNTVCHDRKWIAASETVDHGGNRPAQLVALLAFEQYLL
jgi:hypothetical protein